MFGPKGERCRLSRPRPLRAGRGPRFNPSKLLIDPYAKAIEGPIAFELGPVLLT